MAFSRADRRREPRDPLTASLSILSTDQDGRETVMHATLLDISAKGARLSTLQKLPLRSSVTFYHHKFGIGGRGTVRFCRTGPKGYEVGLEFPNGTGWSKALREKAGLLNLSDAIKQEQQVSPEASSELPSKR